MIYSSADILRALGSDAIIRQEARLSIVDGRPGLGVDEYVYIYVDRYPTVEDYEAVWKVWVVNGGSDLLDLVLGSMTTLLPNFDFNGAHYTVTDFASEKTVVKTKAEIQLEETREERSKLQEQFKGISKSLQAKAELVKDGSDGKDGKDGKDGLPGRDGRDGRDGKDLEATEVELEDLKNVDQGLALEPGQVLTWDGEKWTNLYVRQSYSPGGALGEAGGDGQVNSDTIVSEDLPTEREDGKGPLRDGDTWYKPSTGQFFVYSGGSWYGIASGGGGGGAVDSVNGQTGHVVLDLDDLENVTAPAPVEGQALVWNGVAWVPRTIGGSGGNCSGISDGGNVDTEEAYPPDCGSSCSGIVDGGNVDTDEVHPPDCGSSDGGDGEGGGIEEAPLDGQQYARENGSWVPIEVGGEVEEAPKDGKHYVRQDGAWVSLADALQELGVLPTLVDGGDFNTGTSAGRDRVFDGGDFT